MDITIPELNSSLRVSGSHGSPLYQLPSQKPVSDRGVQHLSSKRLPREGRGIVPASGVRERLDGILNVPTTETDGQWRPSRNVKISRRSPPADLRVIDVSAD